MKLLTRFSSDCATVISIHPMIFMIFTFHITIQKMYMGDFYLGISIRADFLKMENITYWFNYTSINTTRIQS